MIFSREEWTETADVVKRLRKFDFKLIIMEKLEKLGIVLQKKQLKNLIGGINRIKKANTGCGGNGEPDCCGSNTDCPYVDVGTQATIEYGTCGSDGFCYY